ncbi:hypothetical protein L6164_022399 [Bauhinia variegata]|uniref:Uncharacterized protein n=1 Tax=Bauhinia variegata TaxID=167791 RepID=A0ACB9MFI8_BAUVA|nr:hypothetical protein L6164_022399 [Bauhinia variegata]
MAESEETAKSADNQQSEQVCSFFRNPVNKKNIRKCTIENDDEEEDSKSESSLAIRERALKQAEESLKGKGKDSGDEKLYKGINSYTDYKAGFRREQTIASEKAGGAHGPLRASAHTRVSARFDYQPDICKDYKETG